MNDAESTHDLMQNDTFMWLEQAEGSQMSASVIFNALAEVRPMSQTIPGVREMGLAYQHSFMLLTALAFENLLTGLAVAKKLDWRKLPGATKHSMSNYVRSLTSVSDAEFDLLRRLEEYLVWAGRYVVPMSAERYANQRELRCLRTDDPNTISVLFERLKKELITNAQPIA
jgi:hypothetical protein